MHAALADAVVESGARLVFLCGVDMAALAGSLKGRVDVRHAPSSRELSVQAADAVLPGDVVLVKGSLGSRMAVVVDALKSLAADDVRPGLATG
jgi:UDP-N-acetylmuramoyl-tripeptide--D-alanyl-D-alanine ligase